jgi:hypothetical protein
VGLGFAVKLAKFRYLSDQVLISKHSNLFISLIEPPLSFKQYRRRILEVSQDGASPCKVLPLLQE